MPKPATDYKFRDDDHTAFDPEAYCDHPLMQYVNLVIGRSANCDMLWNCMAARFLKADYEVAYEMLRALVAEGARSQAIRAAARKVLSDPDFELYAAVWKASRHLTTQRDKFAHRCFGVNSSVHALLLLDAKLIGRLIFFEPDAHELKRPGRLGRTVPDDMVKDIEVYELEELRDIALMATITEYMVMSLFQALGPPGERRDGARQWLFEHPQSPLRIDSPTQRTKPEVRPEWPVPVRPHEVTGDPPPPPPKIWHLRV